MQVHILVCVAGRTRLAQGNGASGRTSVDGCASAGAYERAYERAYEGAYEGAYELAERLCPDQMLSLTANV